MVPFQTIPPSEPFGWKDFFDSLKNQSAVLDRQADFLCGQSLKSSSVSSVPASLTGRGGVRFKGS